MPQVTLICTLSNRAAERKGFPQWTSKFLARGHTVIFLLRVRRSIRKSTRMLYRLNFRYLHHFKRRGLRPYKGSTFWPTKKFKCWGIWKEILPRLDFFRHRRVNTRRVISEKYNLGLTIWASRSLCGKQFDRKIVLMVEFMNTKIPYYPLE